MNEGKVKLNCSSFFWGFFRTRSDTSCGLFVNVVISMHDALLNSVLFHFDVTATNTKIVFASELLLKLLEEPESSISDIFLSAFCNREN